jgi:ketosteroid isomerase-like protein
MTIDEVSLNVFKAMNERDFGLFDQLISDEVAFDFPGVGKVEGRRKTVLLLKSILRKFPRLTFTVSEVISRDEKACVVWTNKGISSAGEAYQNSGITLFHFREGKIRFLSDYFKDTSFTRL